MSETLHTSDKSGDALSAQRFKMLEDIARELAGDVVFPTCFDAALRLREALQNPDCSIREIVKLVSLEPLVSAKLLQLSNSVAYSRGGAEVKSLEVAVSRLGIKVVRSTTLAIAMHQLMRSKELVRFKDLAHSIWSHSLRTAAAARVLAISDPGLNAEEAMLAGLVHDLGAFYMLYRATQYPELLERPDSIRYLIAQWHESIGMSLLAAMGLPEEIVEATADHDQPRPAPKAIRTLKDAVYVGNILADGHLGWLYQDIDPAAGEPELLREIYREYLPVIDAATEEMHALYGI